MKGKMKMNEELKYAEQWDLSSIYFYKKKYYSWMAKRIKGYRIVLEIGCGTGYSTLALAEQGYKVIAIDKNKACILKAQKLLNETEYAGQVEFLNGDITDIEFRKKLVYEYDFDIVTCWNIGTYWNKEMIGYYLPHMLKYGLKIQQISENPESSYAELIVWETCRIASEKGVAANIVDRGSKKINRYNDPYYYMLKNEFSFSKITYDNKTADSLSDDGRILTTNGIVHHDKVIPIIFVSVLYK